MKTITTIIFALVCFIGAGAQKPQSKGFCKVTEVTKDNGLSPNKVKLIIKFIGPNNKPVKSNVKFVYNSDSLFPVINEQGKYSVILAPGKYKMRFTAPYWYDVKPDSIICNKQTYISLTVKFEAKDF